MSVLSPKRVLFSVVAAALLTADAFAVSPSPRSYPRMAFDQQAGEAILFGGLSEYDRGTQMAYDGTETWAFTGLRWSQRFPKHVPPGRSAQMMAYDSLRGRVVMFGGRQQAGLTTGEARVLADMWVWDANDWTQLTPAALPPARQLAAMAYDPLRDRLVLYGGSTIAADGLTTTALYDTWEFDGTTWRKVGDEAVKIGHPLLAWDKARGEMIMLGVDAETKTHMYRFDPSSAAWSEIKPETLPECVNEGGLVYQDHNRTLMTVGGVCATTTSFTDKTFEWNGTNWAEVKVEMSRATGFALAYDSLRSYALMFGGSDAFSTKPRGTTLMYRNSAWRFVSSLVRPSPRSLFSFEGDPVNKAVWLMGGLNEYSTGYEGDFWGYRNGNWFFQAWKTPPASCEFPMAAFDPDRSRLVLACSQLSSSEIDVFEFDGANAEFKHIQTSKDRPEARRQGALVYDRNLKKIVLFGGYDGANFRDDTWTWDGANWTEVRKNKPPNRSLHAMWYDPLMKKTVLYGGIGRENIDERVKRLSDMWSFDGTGWTKLTVSTTPGERLGAQYAVDPASGKLLLFGGLKAELTDPANERSLRQYYDSETWSWDGASSTWTKLSPASSPGARQNGRMTFDPTTNRIMLFGGYAGHFFSDVWYWTGSNWEVLPEPTGGRRRPSGPPAPPPPTGD